MFYVSDVKKKHFASKKYAWQRSGVETSNFHPSPCGNWIGRPGITDMSHQIYSLDAQLAPS
jgi:hypothetical protein